VVEGATTPLATSRSNSLGHTLRISQHLHRSNTDQCNALRCEKLSPLQIALRPIPHAMRRPIDLNSQLRRGAI